MNSEELLSLVSNRRRFLSYIDKEQSHKRDIVDDMGVSRSTVDRALSDLSNEQLVVRTDQGYKITKKGKISLETIESSLATLVSIENGTKLLNYLPRDIDVPPSVFEESEVYPSEEPNPLMPVERSVNRLEACDRVIGLPYGDTHPKLSELFFERSRSGELEVELVVNQSFADHVITRYGSQMAYYYRNQNHKTWVNQDVEFGFLLFYEGDGERLHLNAHGPMGNHQGHIETSSTPAIRWAENAFRELKRDGRPLIEYMKKQSSLS
jgi:predicted transcriptional regulator